MPFRRQTRLVTRTQLTRDLVQLNQSKLSSLGVVFAWLASDSDREYLTKNPLALFGGATPFEDGVQGPALLTHPGLYQPNNGISTGVNAGPVSAIFPNSSNYTIFVYRRCLDTVARQSTLFGWDYGLQRVLTHAPWEDGNLHWYFADYNNGSSVSTPFVKTVEPELLTFTAGLAGGEMSVWRNDVRIAHSPTAARNKTNTTGNFYIGGVPDFGPGSLPSDRLENYYLLVCNRLVEQDEIRELANNPASILEPIARTVFIPYAESSLVLVGTNSFQNSQSSSGASTQIHALQGANASQTSQSNTAQLSQAQDLAGSSSNQSALSDSLAVTQTHVLAGSASSQSNESTAGAVSQPQTLTGEVSSQTAESSVGAVGQAHGLTGLGAAQDNQATSLAVTQVHALQGASSASAGQSSGAAIGQGNALAGSASTQSAGSSAASIGQTHSLVASNSQSVNTSTTGELSLSTSMQGSACSQVNGSGTADLSQTHSLIGATSNQINVGSVADISGSAFLGASHSVQNNASPAAAITALQLLQGSNCGQANQSVSLPITQRHIVVGANSVQSNLATVNAISQIVRLLGANCVQINTSSSGFLFIPGAGPFDDYSKNMVYVVAPEDRTFVIAYEDRSFVIER